MKKILLVIITAFGLVGCSNNDVAGGSNGKVDCYSIKVTNGGTAVFQQTYQATFSRVFEYKNDKGQSLFTSNRSQYYKRDIIGNLYLADSIIKAYSDRYTNDYVEYSFNRFVGFLTMEYNYYLDFHSRTIDSETKWSEYKYENDPIALEEGEASNNKEAFECAKKHYYQLSESGAEFVSLRLDLIESNLERHTYTQVGNESVITYKAKWF